MGLKDFRTVSEDQMSFYVFDDLRFQQNQRGDFDIYRFDTLREALEKFRNIPADMTPALGIHLNARSELDIMHRREGEVHLVTDYKAYSDWRQSPHVLHAVNTACDELRPEWQMNSKCVGETVLIPLERSFERIPDPVFADKQLNPKPPRFYGNRPTPLSAINEAYVPNEGWVDFKDFFKRASEFGFHNPHCMKVQQFNINYIDSKGHTGQADVSPMDMQILWERYTFQHGEEYSVNTARDRLADEVAELLVQGPFQEEYKESVRKDLREGNLQSVTEGLQTMRDYGDTDQQIAAAQRLLARVGSLSLSKPSLEHQMLSAFKRSVKHKTTSDREQNGLER